MNLFRSRRDSRLRAFWRIALQTILMAALGIVPILAIAEPLTALHRRGLFLPALSHEAYDRVINMIVGPFLAAAVIASVAIAAKRLDRRRFAEFGVRFDRRWWAGLAFGFGVGAVVMTVVFLAQYWLGWVVVTGFCVRNVADVSLPLGFGFSIVKVLCVGTYEEFVSRGYHLRNIAEALGLRWGVLLSSAAFALLHLTSPNATVLSTVGLFANGLMLASAFLATGRLSTAIGLHIAWNLFEGAVWGFPVSGDKEGTSVVGIQQLGPEIVTGGAFGPEAGLMGVAASLAAIGALSLYAKRLGARRWRWWSEVEPRLEP